MKYEKVILKETGEEIHVWRDGEGAWNHYGLAGKTYKSKELEFPRLKKSKDPKVSEDTKSSESDTSDKDK